MNEIRQFEDVRNLIYQNYQQYRIIQPNVVYVHGLPQKLSSIQQLQSHLTIYGKISSLSIQFISKNFYSCFVKYITQTSAALAIIALNGFYIDKRFLKVSFASTKFCPNFMKGFTCYLHDCNYAHYYVGQLTYLKQFTKQINHQALAFNKIYQNYQDALAMYFENSQQSIFFPSGLSKLNQILLKKSEQFQNWQKNIQQSIQILQNRLHKIKIQKQSQTINKLQITNKSSKQPSKDQWLNLDGSIGDFIEQETQQNIKSLKRSKTKIQKFLDQAETALMDMIFNSTLRQTVLEVKKN